MAKVPFFRVVGLALLLSLASGPHSEAAEEIARTARFFAMSHTTAGKLYGCGFAFSHVGPDHVYERGLPVLLSGSTSTFYVKGTTPGVLLKLVGYHFDSTAMNMQPFRVHYAYPIINGESLAGEELSVFRCEDGGFCAVYDQNNFDAILAAVYQNELTLSYNRDEGSMDVSVTFDWMQADDDAQANILKGTTCYLELVGRFERQD